MKVEGNEFEPIEGEGYKCPICQHLVLKLDENNSMIDDKSEHYGLMPCPHLVFIRFSGHDDYQWVFLFARKDYVQNIIKIVLEDDDLNQRLTDDEIIIGKEDISVFLKGKFDFLDKISGRFASIAADYDERLLSPHTTLYSNTLSYYTGVQFAFES